MSAYYNENDAYAAQWLRNLIAAGHIAPGEVDERSIVDVRADDLRGYKQVHCFAGIGVWSHALRLAGWPDDREVWTGSCPCQPFSAAGKGGADEDARHIWPHWLRLIAECRPSIIFGEQVSAAIRIGWLDDVFTSLEQLHYACGAIDFPACSVGAPHIRQRLYFVAESLDHAADARRPGAGEHGSRSPLLAARSEQHGAALAVADSEQRPSKRRGHDLAGAPDSLEGEARQRERLRDESRAGIDARGVADAQHSERRSINGPEQDERNWDDAGRAQAHGIAGACGEVRSLADPAGERERAEQSPQGRRITEHGCGEGGELGDPEINRSGTLNGQSRSGDGRQEPHRGSGIYGATNGFWRDAEWLPCIDGKARPTKPGLFPLAYGITNRVGKLRAAGNAICAEAAAEFIRAYMSVIINRKEKTRC